MSTPGQRASDAIPDGVEEEGRSQRCTLVLFAHGTTPAETIRHQQGYHRERQDRCEDSRRCSGCSGWGNRERAVLGRYLKGFDGLQRRFRRKMPTCAAYPPAHSVALAGSIRLQRGLRSYRG